LREADAERAKWAEVRVNYIAWRDSDRPGEGTCKQDLTRLQTDVERSKLVA
jgi:hypothetical protein